MTFSIQFKVGDLLDIILINDTKLTCYINILAVVNVQYV